MAITAEKALLNNQSILQNFGLVEAIDEQVAEIISGGCCHHDDHCYPRQNDHNNDDHCHHGHHDHDNDDHCHHGHRDHDNNNCSMRY